MSSFGTFASTVSDDVLERLYSILASTGAPGLPGPTHESTLALLEALRDNFKKNHTFVNDLGFHKQVPVLSRSAPSHRHGLGPCN
jgi:hypothetical protein